MDQEKIIGYKDSYNYYDIDVDKILLFKKSEMVYFVRHNDVNKKKIVRLQLKTNNFSFGNLYMFTRDTTLVPIFSDENAFFRSCRET